MTFELLRINKNNICTFGVMFDDSGLPFIVTLELPDLNNQENISCITRRAIYRTEVFKS